VTRRPGSSSQSLPYVFICYRREDTSGYAGRLYDALQPRFGERLFMDVDSLSPGSDFVDVINETVGRSDVMLTLIGRNWLEARDRHGNRRLDDPEDYVRLEVATALERGIRLVPVLVGGAEMPTADSLPGDIAGLTRRHSVSLADEGWRSGVTDLVGRLQSGTPPRAVATPRLLSRLPRAARTRGAVVLALVALVALATLVWPGVLSGRTSTPSTTAGGRVLARLVPTDIDTSRHCKQEPPPPPVVLAQTELICTTNDLPHAVLVGFLYPDLASFRTGLAGFNKYVGFSISAAGPTCPPQDPYRTGITYGATSDALTECWVANAGTATTQNLLWTIPKSNALFSLGGGPTSTWDQLSRWYQQNVAPGLGDTRPPPTFPVVPSTTRLRPPPTFPAATIPATIAPSTPTTAATTTTLQSPPTTRFRPPPTTTIPRPPTTKG
jgi:hypothetical protein